MSETAHRDGLLGDGAPSRVSPTNRISTEAFQILFSVSEAIILSITMIGLAFVFGSKPLALSYIGLSLLIPFSYLCLSTLNSQRLYLGGKPVDIEKKLKFLSVVFISFIILVFLLKVGSQYSRLWATTSYFASVFIIVAFGHVGKLCLARLIEGGRVANNVIIYGGSKRTQQLIRSVKRDAPGCRIVGIIDVRSTRFPKANINALRGQSLDALVDMVCKADVQSLILDLPWAAEDRIREIKRAFEAIDIDIILAPSHIDLFEDSYDIVTFGKQKTIALYARPVRGVQYATKKVIDWLGGLLLFLMASPVLLLIALAIRLESPGPIFFRQHRQGFNNRPFEMLKFRSMYAHMGDVNASQLTQRNDPRVTRVGRFIRSTSLDELPQIFNVLRGEMSLVGPRPHAFGALAGHRPYIDVVERYAARHRVLPGITGLAQVRGFRGNTETEDDILYRVESDLEYIRKWSIWRDVEILVRTLFVFIFQRNAF